MKFKNSKNAQLVFIFLLCTVKIFSQSTDQFGINLRLSSAHQVWDYKINIPDNPLVENTNLIGVYLFYKLPIKESFFFQPQLNYLQKGFLAKYNTVNQYGMHSGNFEAIQKLRYCSIDLLLGLSGKSDKLVPYFKTGPRLDFLLNYETENINNEDIYTEIFSQFNNISLGMLLAVGFNVRNLFNIEIEYNPDLLKSMENSNVSIRNQLWSINLGISINRKSNE